MTTSTTLAEIVEPDFGGCWNYCKNKGEYMLGACMPSVKSCTTYMWTYVKEGNRFCPRDNMGLDRVCCCGNNLRLLTNETIPAKNDPQLLQYIENYELE